MKIKFKGEILAFYISLVFFLIPIAGLVTGLYNISILPITALAIVAYLYMVHSKEHRKVHVKEILPWTYLLGYIVYMSVFISAPNIFFMFYPSNLIVWKFKDKIKSFRFISFFVTITLTTAVVLLYRNHSTVDNFTIFAFYFICMATFFLQMKIRDYEEQRKREIAHNEYVNALLAENERNRIGRDLHDTLGHIFVTISVKAQLATKLMEKKEFEKAEKEIREIGEITQKSMSETRQIISDLKFRTLSEVIENIKSVLEGAGISYEVFCEKEMDNLDSAVQGQINMIIREGINNVVKHSKAEHVKITVKKENNRVENEIAVIIEDDGVGFSKITGEELGSIRGRMKNINGEIKIIHQKNPTRVKATFKIDDIIKNIE